MAGAESSAIAGLRRHGALDAGTATVWLVLAGAAIFLLETGQVVLSGPAAELAAGEAVQRAYLGGPARG